MRLTAGLRAIGIVTLAVASTLTVAAPSVAAASPSAVTAPSAALRVVRVAEAQRGKRYAYGASGPSAFDCSGLVRYAYRLAGVGDRIGGGHSAAAMLAWGRAHHLTSRSDPQVGDVVIYGNGSHAAIYIGGGQVISALNPSQGIRITALHALRQPFTAFIHTGLAGEAAAPPPSDPDTAAVATVRLPAAAPSVKTRVYANLRAAASTASRVIAVVRPGVRLEVTGSKVVAGWRWDRVVYRDHACWVRSDLVRPA